MAREPGPGLGAGAAEAPAPGRGGARARAGLGTTPPGRGARVSGLSPPLGRAGLDWAGRREPRPGLYLGPPRSRLRRAGRPRF